jgi:hypothetical protein
LRSSAIEMTPATSPSTLTHTAILPLDWLVAMSISAALVFTPFSLSLELEYVKGIRTVKSVMQAVEHVGGMIHCGDVLV